MTSTSADVPALWAVRRSSTGTRISSAALLAAGVALFAVPFGFAAGVVQQLTTLFIFMILAVMWNALAGYGGQVSVGQQAYLGSGAYATIFLTQHAVPPYLAVLLAAVASALLAVLLAPLLLRLRGGQFAVGSWVVAETLALLVALDADLGGGTGISLRGLNAYAPNLRRAYTYWITLAILLLLLGLVVYLLRHRMGVALQAIRDDEDAAAALGVRTGPLKFGLFVLAGFGCGAAGALTLANTLFIQPQSIFGVQWTAYMIFMVLVGGIGTFEGPILGAILFFLLQQQFAQYGAGYLIGLGIIAAGFALYLPRGLWSLPADRLHLRLLPVGYHLQRRVARPSARRSDV
ncbi:branched-chain amino acid ABC transporter permease [Actinoplanes regularis]|uniref:Amino acid/amide ABC transporter membrane protein 2, HAAT family n=1 Tax=Actinoplanes regularis TaxID=52697 RepID=A0A238VZZ4_9ACTN|nr:branched-chain amino acid ABC transporter permease [Actinoplanes regularis]GIE91959.1 branched-chain amino acid ABC transporter permease [Actinoplanes regularis]SNR39741.1 amino acid/amide ABC transporter membrane protein 2, HAAT family [Actinoplanes regularis]